MLPRLNNMKKRNLKKIVKDLKVLLEELESEVYSNPSAYVHPWYEQTEGPRVGCLLYTSPSPRDKRQSRMPSSA